MESEQEMMTRISKLAGQINRHKNQQPASASASHFQAQPGAPYPTPNYNAQVNQGRPPSRGGYSRGRGYYRGGKPNTIHRNRTLVLNNANTGSKPDGAQDDISGAAAPAPAWVTKTDRHMQLINPAIYEKQSQDRARAIEETRKLRLKQRDDREKFKLNKHLERLSDNMGGHGANQRAPQALPNYEITVQGIRFRVMKDGSKLAKVPGDENAAKLTPKSATVGGVRFYRSKNGNLYRSGIVKAQRQPAAIKKIDEPCRLFSTTGICAKGPRCRYTHDPAKVAICKDFLQTGACAAGDSCDLSHEATPSRTPACLHFARGNCANENCRYAHVRVSASAPVCRAFAVYGFCERGAECDERHVVECPEFSRTGECKTKGCKLPHRLKASMLRKNAAKEGEEGEGSDLESEEEEGEEIGSDDVDSDDLEVLGLEGERDADMLERDYVQL
ncbi:hypothetical protein VE03_07317 [Pseudogymnoascus sp. 23342-1-I1]|nr:hypothetical protein VE03_07317 [Pseudogymnoascus sp. 23342-1-I1]